MRASIIIAAYNEGGALAKTIRACADTCATLDHEIVVADDASTDDSVEDAMDRFRNVRFVRHKRRCGASPTKHLGTRDAHGEVLVFLDGHCKPESGAIRQLVEDVELLEGEAIVTPAIPALDVGQWKNDPRQVGRGYRMDLKTFGCGWLPRGRMRAVQEGRRQFHESPALIGCALAISRSLYDRLWGFDAHMRVWGVEDLDFGLKCWLMGARILHDSEARIGHRFRRRFDNYDVPFEHVVVNQLRMACKHFSQSVWAEWLDRCRQRHPGRLREHPEGLWARVWQLFEQDRSSVEEERSYLQANRAHDEFWYAKRFGLNWPRLAAEGAKKLRGPISAEDPSGSPSPSPPPCKLTGASPSSSSVCHDPDAERVYTAEGTGALENASWTTWPAGFADPETGTGKTFTTKWLYARTDLKVKATCCGTTKQANVRITKLDRIEVYGTSDTGPKAVPVDTTVKLAARASMGGLPWPDGQPTWEILSQPEGSSVTPSPTTGRVVEVTPTHPGTYRVKATCGSESDTFDVIGVKVTFGAIVRTGYGNPPSEFEVKVTETATVEPASHVQDVDIVPAEEAPGRILIDEVRYVGGTIEFDVKGQDRTPPDKPNGDTTIEARLDGEVCGQVPAVVHVPASLVPVSENGAVPGENLDGWSGSSPKYIGALAPDWRHLWTFYGHWLDIYVLDQFGYVLPAFYNGADVTEHGNVPINQKIQGFGFYRDPVGDTKDRAGATDFHKDRDEVTAWLNGTPPPMVPPPPRPPINQEIPVQIAGHQIAPNIVRQVIFTAPSNVQIIWAQ